MKLLSYETALSFKAKLCFNAVVSMKIMRRQKQTILIAKSRKTSAFPNFLRQSLENNCVQHMNDSEITSKDTQ